MKFTTLICLLLVLTTLSLYQSRALTRRHKSLSQYTNEEIDKMPERKLRGLFGNFLKKAVKAVKSLPGKIARVIKKVAPISKLKAWLKLRELLQKQDAR